MINCTGKCSNPCGGAVCVGNLFGHVRDVQGSDCFKGLIVSRKKDAEFGLLGLQLGGCCGARGASFHGGDVLSH